MPVQEKRRGILSEREEAEFHTIVARVAGGGAGQKVGASGRGGGQPPPQREWSVVPAVVVISLVAALLTFLGMLTQMWANVAGAQLPGS